MYEYSNNSCVGITDTQKDPEVCALMNQQKNSLEILQKNIESLFSSIEIHKNRIGMYLSPSLPENDAKEGLLKEDMTQTEIGRIIKEKNSKIDLLCKLVYNAETLVNDLTRRFEG